MPSFLFVVVTTFINIKDSIPILYLKRFEAEIKIIPRSVKHLSNHYLNQTGHQMKCLIVNL